MPITIEHKLGLLHDLLQNHVTEHFLTVNETEQLQHLLVALSKDPALDPSLTSTIAAISSATETNTIDDAAVDEWLNQMSSLI
ncbi:YtzH-like family protein [Bacillus sp. JCM 19041]|uniref:YtzH-like family protein n=1 Tax=Bacillus sp. JCM 19041 TaxID=1460637 RepID=UPI0006D052F1